MRQNENQYTQINRNLIIVIGIAIIWLLVIAIRMHFSPDEFEHIHSAWLVSQGFLPYHDFFQNHHPLFWYIISPLIALLGYSSETVIAIRIFMLFITIMIGLVTFKLAKRITGSPTVGLISMALLLTTEMFYHRSIEIRPDVPQVLLALLALYFLFNFFQTKQVKDSVMSGICLAASFLFLQKSIFLLGMIGILLCWQIYKRKVPTSKTILFGIAFIVPLLFYGIYLIWTNSLQDYWAFNWLSNFKRPKGFSPFETIFRWLSSSNLWLLMPFAIFNLWRTTVKRGSFDLKALSLMGLGVIGSTFLVPHPFSQYFMLMIPLICIINSVYLNQKMEQGLTKRFKIWMIVIVIVIPVFNFLIITRSSNQPELDRVNFIVKQTNTHDYVYNISENLFRKDPHFLWMVRPGLIWSSNFATNNKYKNFDPIVVIKEKLPKIINSGFIKPENGLDKYYKETRYPGIAIRKYSQGGKD